MTTRMNTATQDALDARLLRVHARWCELTAEYQRVYGAITPAVFYALFDRAVIEAAR